MGHSPGAVVPDSLADALGAVVDSQTYRNLSYLVLAFPLGIVYYFLLVFGFVLGVGLAVFLVGLLVLLGVVFGTRFVAGFERRLANALLGTDIGEPDDVERSAEGAVARVGAYLRAESTWKGLGFVVLKFPVGLVSFVLLVSLLGTAVEFLLLPLYPGGVFNIRVGGWRVARTFGTETGRLLAVPVGAVLAVVAVTVLNAFAAAIASVASSLLGPSAGADGGAESERPA
jgi:hypothetical protein